MNRGLKDRRDRAESTSSRDIADIADIGVDTAFVRSFETLWKHRPFKSFSIEGQAFKSITDGGDDGDDARSRRFV